MMFKEASHAVQTGRRTGAESAVSLLPYVNLEAPGISRPSSRGDCFCTVHGSFYGSYRQTTLPGSPDLMAVIVYPAPGPDILVPRRDGSWVNKRSNVLAARGSGCTPTTQYRKSSKKAGNVALARTQAR